VNGDYTFYTAADDPDEVWLSTDESPANRRLICLEPSWNNVRDYRTLDRRNPADPENVSDPVPLVAGQRYYFEVLHTEGGGGDNVSVAWRVPGAPEVQSGDPPIAAQYVESYVNPDQFAATLSGLAPEQRPANQGAFTLTVSGSGFRTDSVVYWEGEARATTFLNDTTLAAAITADDVTSTDELLTAKVTVVNLLGVDSNPKVFTVTGGTVAQAQSDVAALGETVAAAAPPVGAGEPGVAAAVRNEGDPEPVVITAATYSAPPVAAPPPSLIEVGGGYVDVKVSGADPADSATSYFYYPANLAPSEEAAVTLLYFDGAAWTPVLSRGGVMPVKDLTDNLDGTVSGGRFTVVFDHTSSPRLSQLTGSVFSPVKPLAPPPTAVNDLFERPANDTFKVLIADLLKNDSVPAALTGVTPVSARGGTVEVRGAWVIYRSKPGDREADSFGYTISDGAIGLAAATVQLTVQPDDHPARNIINAPVWADGQWRVTFAGIPGRTYTVEYSTDLENWTALGPVTVGATGIAEFSDSASSDPVRFYRFMQP
jgi:hypothetical protein